MPTHSAPSTLHSVLQLPTQRVEPASRENQQRRAVQKVCKGEVFDKMPARCLDITQNRGMEMISYAVSLVSDQSVPGHKISTRLRCTSIGVALISNCNTCYQLYLMVIRRLDRTYVLVFSISIYSIFNIAPICSVVVILH